MINSINSSTIPMRQGHEIGGVSLSTEQQQLISDTLSKYDFDNLSESDALSIVEAFNEAGIQPSNALADAMSEAGFDARTVGEMAGVQGGRGPQGGPPPPPPEANSGVTLDEESMSQLITLLDQLYSEEMDEVTRKQAVDNIRDLLLTDEGLFSAEA